MTNQLALGALGDPTRRAIFEQLSGRPAAVGELASLLPVSRPAVSQHLKVLTDAGLVTHHRDGSRRIYRLDPQGIAELRDYLDRFWGQALSGFKAVAEQGPADARAGSRAVQQRRGKAVPRRRANKPGHGPGPTPGATTEGEPDE
jgi:DNA-binding transcriptional ArsR family regulator